MTERVTIGERVARLRSSRGWTYARLAERSGLSRAYLKNLEDGLRTPKYETRVKLAGAFGISLGELLSGVEGAEEELALTKEPTVYPDVAAFDVMLHDTRRTNPGLARRIMEIGWQLRRLEQENYEADRKQDGAADEDTTPHARGGSEQTDH